MHTILRLSPVFKTMIWGGERLRTEFNFDIPSDHTGEAWVVSSHPEGNSLIKFEHHEPVPLSQYYRDHRAMFGPGINGEFPILVKIIDANKDLSIQVHPDDTYARQEENSQGKSECWLILDCEPNTKLILGHHAHDKATFIQKFVQREFTQLFREVSIHKGDFFYVPAGTLHAICEGTLIYEIQQNSAVTYRVYDYDRVDVSGKRRELHIDKAMNVLTCPSQPLAVYTPLHSDENITQRVLLDNEFFKIRKLTIQDELKVHLSEVFMIVGIIEGVGSINGVKVVKGDHVIVLPKEEQVHFFGALTAIIIEPHISTLM